MVSRYKKIVPYVRKYCNVTLLIRFARKKKIEKTKFPQKFNSITIIGNYDDRDSYSIRNVHSIFDVYYLRTLIFDVDDEVSHKLYRNDFCLFVLFFLSSPSLFLSRSVLITIEGKKNNVRYRTERARPLFSSFS